MIGILIFGAIFWAGLAVAIVRCVHEHRSTEERSAAAYDVEG